MADMPDYGGEGYRMMRPAMKQDMHPEHQMPPPEHDGTQLSVEEYKAKLTRTTASNYAIQPGKAKE